MKAIEAKDFTAMARNYNGEDYGNYDDLMKKAYDALEREKNKMIRYLAMGVLSWCAVAPYSPVPLCCIQGKYEGLMLAVTPEHQVEGFYAEELGEGVTRGCAFYLQGQPDVDHLA